MARLPYFEHVAAASEGEAGDKEPGGTSIEGSVVGKAGDQRLGTASDQEPGGILAHVYGANPHNSKQNAFRPFKK